MGALSDMAKLQKPAPIPKGWRTCARIAREEDRSESHMCNVLRTLVRGGVWEMQPWKMVESGRIRQTFIYRKRPIRH